MRRQGDQDSSAFSAIRRWRPSLSPNVERVKCGGRVEIREGAFLQTAEQRAAGSWIATSLAEHVEAQSSKPGEPHPAGTFGGRAAS
jgi:hypothetical protein